MKRITKLKDLRAGVRYMRVSLNGEGRYIKFFCVPKGRPFVDKYFSGDGYITANLVFTRTPLWPNEKDPIEYADTWLKYNHTYKWTAKAEAFFDTLAKDQRRMWQFFTGKHTDCEWKDQLCDWEEDRLFNRQLFQ